MLIGRCAVLHHQHKERENAITSNSSNIYETRKMSRDFPGFLHVSRDFPCLPGISNAFPEALSFELAKECPPPNTHKNVEVLVLSVCTAYRHGPIHQICLSVWGKH